ncbi:MAG: hypothetical protein ACJ8FY_20065 [Gemmataceae bacterium]
MSNVIERFPISWNTMVFNAISKNITRRVNSPTAANTTPSLNTAVLAMTPGKALDELVERSVLRGTAPGKARGSSTSWEGAQVIVNRLTELGWGLRLQLQSGRWYCSVFRLLENEEMKELTEAEAGNLPEAVAKAAILACIQPDKNTECFTKDK